jgi:hypothetical protein
VLSSLPSPNSISCSERSCIMLFLDLPRLLLPSTTGWLGPLINYLEGMDAASIAEITGLSAANVWTRIHRIKGLLTRQFHGGVANA